MRTISAALLAAQQTGRTPFIKLLFTSRDGGTTYNYSTSSGRLMSMEHHEEPYDSSASIMLNNSDLAIPDLRGYWVEIAYGCVTGNAVAEPNGNGVDAEYSYTSRLWVKNQYIVSAQGVLRVILSLKGIWTVMQEQLLLLGTQPLHKLGFAAITVYGILEEMIEEHLGTATGLVFTLSPLAESDGIIDSYNPAFELGAVPFEPFAVVLQFLMEMTKCYIRAQTGLNFEIKFPQDADATDESYYSDAASGYVFHEYTETRNLSIPNHIIVYANFNSEGWIDGVPVIGEAYDEDEFTGTVYDGQYMEVRGLDPAPKIDNETDANARAAAILTKAKAEIISGRLVIMHDARVELYDRVAVEDSRGT